MALAACFRAAQDPASRAGTPVPLPPPNQHKFKTRICGTGTQPRIAVQVPMPMAALVGLVGHSQVERREVRPRREGGLGLRQQLLDALRGGQQRGRAVM